MSHKELPVEVVKEIKRQAKEYAKKHGRKEIGYYAMNWEDGATTYATQLHQAQQDIEERIDKALHAERNKFQGILTKAETEWVKKLQEIQQENSELRRQNEKLKEQAAGWRPLLEDILKNDYISEDLIDKITKFLYGE